MRKLVIATHGKLAAGFADTLGMLGAITDGLVSYGFYCDGDNVDDATAERCVAELSPSDQLIVCTDIGFGSVNQAFVRAVAMHPEANVILVSGVNLPLLLELSVRSGEVTRPELEEIVAAAASQLSVIEVPPMVSNDDAAAARQEVAEGLCDEDFFA